MKSEIEQLGPCKIRIKVEIPTDEIRGKIEEKYKEVGASVVLPGFRKGHVPRSILEKRFGKSVVEDAKVDLISGAVTKTVEEKKLSTVGEPDLDVEKVEISVEKPMQFEVTVETKPEVKPKDYLGVAATLKKTPVTDEEMEKAIGRLAERRAEWVPADAAAENDMVIADLSITLDGKPRIEEKAIQVVVAKDIEVLHAPAPQVYEALLGAKAGEERRAKVTAPDTHEDADLKGKTLEFNAKVAEIKRLKKPEIGDAWAKEMDYESLDKLKEDLRRRVQQEKDFAATVETEQQIVDGLLEKHEIPLPETLVAKFEERMATRQRMTLQMRGIAEEEVEKELAKVKTDSKSALEKQLRTHFLLEAIAQKERVFVTEDEVDRRIEGLAARHGRMPGEVREMLEAENQLTELRATLREEKVRKYLREKAKITEAQG
jgi:trigger factor